jgi:hypothetical protein
MCSKEESQCIMKGILEKLKRHPSFSCNRNKIVSIARRSLICSKEESSALHETNLPATATEVGFSCNMNRIVPIYSETESYRMCSKEGSSDMKDILQKLKRHPSY